MGSQQTAPKESQYPIFVALARIECEPLSEHSTNSDRVTNIGYWLSLGVHIYLDESKFVHI